MVALEKSDDVGMDIAIGEGYDLVKGLGITSKLPVLLLRQLTVLFHRRQTREYPI